MGDEEAAAVERAEELERLPRSYVAVLGGPCASSHERTLMHSKRIQLAVVLIANIIITSLLLARYKVK
jgi:hypothetical protein